MPQAAHPALRTARAALFDALAEHCRVDFDMPSSPVRFGRATDECELTLA